MNRSDRDGDREGREGREDGNADDTERPDRTRTARRTEVLDAEGRPTSLRGRVGLAFRRDPTRGLVVLLLALFGLSFLVAGVVVFWGDIVGFVVGLLRSMVG